MSSPSIAIIGAGMAGIICARALANSGFTPVIFEKSRRIGGRLSTRQTRTGLFFDHGAQYITAKTKTFADQLSTLSAAGHCRAWLRADTNISENPTKTERFVGVPAMNRLLVPLIDDLTIHLETTILPLSGNGRPWALKSIEYGDHGSFDYVISTIPQPQARAFFHTHPLAKTIDDVRMLPCWALMLAFETPLKTSFIAHKDASADLTWIARNSDKPSRPTLPDCWIAHASPDWSQQNLDSDQDKAAEELYQLFMHYVEGSTPEPIYRAAHRWRYAMTQKALGKAFERDATHTLYAGGDWCLGARVEDAFSSGKAIAEAIINDAR